MKNSLIILALASTLFASSAFAQGSTVTTQRTITTTKSALPHDAAVKSASAANSDPAKACVKGSKTCPTCGSCISNKKAKAIKATSAKVM